MNFTSFVIIIGISLVKLPIAFSQSQVISQDQSKISFEGYGEFSLTYDNYPEFFYRKRDAGPQRDNRFSGALSTLVLNVDNMIDAGLHTHTEVDFMHQGIEAENEPNHLGPFADIHSDHGIAGGVILRQMYFSKVVTKHTIIAVGRVPIAIGYQFENAGPLSFPSTEFWQTESHIIPGDWTELGVSLDFESDFVKSTTQIVNGLDSSGFGSRRWVAQGQQGRFGSVSMTDPAIVERLDFRSWHILKPGIGIYYGETSRNRPTPDLANRCAEHVESDAVAPCGYAHVPVTILDIHLSAKLAAFRSRMEFLSGFLKNAGAVNGANGQDQSNLPEFYTPVASGAFGAVGEIGYELDSSEQLRIVPFILYEHFDTMAKPVTVVDDSSVYDRRRAGLGCSIVWNKNLFLKIELSRLWFGDSKLTTESTGELVTGFVF